MTTEQEYLKALAASLEPGNDGGYRIKFDVPLDDDGTVDAQDLVQSVLDPAIELLARFAHALAEARGLTPWDVVESMLWELRFDDMLGPIDGMEISNE